VVATCCALDERVPPVCSRDRRFDRHLLAQIPSNGRWAVRVGCLGDEFVLNPATRIERVSWIWGGGTRRGGDG